jgi:hypothetical protein
MELISMDEKRSSRLIGKMTTIAIFAKKYNVAYTPLDDYMSTLSHVIKLINQRNLYMEEPMKCVEVLFPSAYKMKPLTVLLTDCQIKDIKKIDNRLLLEERSD